MPSPLGGLPTPSALQFVSVRPVGDAIAPRRVAHARHPRICLCSARWRCHRPSSLRRRENIDADIRRHLAQRNEPATSTATPVTGQQRDMGPKKAMKATKATKKAPIKAAAKKEPTKASKATAKAPKTASAASKATAEAQAKAPTTASRATAKVPKAAPEAEPTMQEAPESKLAISKRTPPEHSFKTWYFKDRRGWVLSRLEVDIQNKAIHETWMRDSHAVE